MYNLIGLLLLDNWVTTSPTDGAVINNIQHDQSVHHQSNDLTQDLVISSGT